MYSQKNPTPRILEHVFLFRSIEVYKVHNHRINFLKIFGNFG